MKTLLKKVQGTSVVAITTSGDWFNKQNPNNLFPKEAFFCQDGNFVVCKYEERIDALNNSVIECRDTVAVTSEFGHAGLIYDNIKI